MRIFSPKGGKKSNNLSLDNEEKTDFKSINKVLNIFQKNE